MTVFCKCGRGFYSWETRCSQCGILKEVEMPVVTTTNAQTFEEFLTNAGFPTYPCDCRRPAPDMIYDKAWPHRQCKGCRGFLGPARVMAIDTTDKPSRDTPNKAWPFAGMDVGVRAWWDERYIDAGNDAVVQKARNVWAKALSELYERHEEAPEVFRSMSPDCDFMWFEEEAQDNGDFGDQGL